MQYVTFGLLALALEREVIVMAVVYPVKHQSLVSPPILKSGGDWEIPSSDISTW